MLNIRFKLYLLGQKILKCKKDSTDQTKHKNSKAHCRDEYNHSYGMVKTRKDGFKPNKTSN